MQWHTVEDLGPKQSLTAAGFLLCRDVPVARTGTQLYHQSEIPQLAANSDGLLRIERDAADVFDPDAVASFEGAPVVIGHPNNDDFVSPDTWRGLSIGHVQNVHRGSPPDDDLLLADMLITDRRGIDAVRGGMRGVSAGYDASYTQSAAGYGRQGQIRANHIALVPDPRCGARCMIGDAAWSGTSGLSGQQLVWQADRIRATHDRSTLRQINAANRRAWSLG